MMICAKNYENASTFVKVIHWRLRRQTSSRWRRDVQSI